MRGAAPRSRGATPARARRGGPRLCPARRLLPAAARRSWRARSAGRSRCSGGDSRELGGARGSHGQGAAAAPSHSRRGARGGDCTVRPAAAGVVNLTQVARGWESGVRGSGSAGKRGLDRRRRALPLGLRLPSRSRGPWPCAPPRLSLGHRVPQRSADGESVRRRPPLSGLHAPRYITLDREESAAASALPQLGPPRPPGAPRPRPSPPPARRPPSAEQRRGSPSHMAVAAASSAPRTSHRGSRPHPHPVVERPDLHPPGRTVAAPGLSSSGRPVLACPPSSHFR